MKFSAILSPVHQSQQQLIRPAQLGRPAKIPQVSLHYRQHLFEDAALHTG